MFVVIFKSVEKYASSMLWGNISCHWNITMHGFIRSPCTLMTKLSYEKLQSTKSL